MRGTGLIERYIGKAIAPYLLLSLALLTMILFVQQSARFADLLIATQAPLDLLWEVAFSLLPNVLAFTVPMATLAGTIIGYSRMSSDSELIAMRAAGVSSLRLLWPALLIGALLGFCSFLINFELAPDAARSLRHAGIQAALRRLDSPVDPRTFNADIPGYVVYVGDGDKVQGRWERVFIYSQDGGTKRLITARSGRIDAAAEQSELVLSDAVATTLPADNDLEGRYVTERLAQLRIVLETGRKGLLKSLHKDEADPDEMRLWELISYLRGSTGQDKRAASILLHRRLSLSFAPLVFSLLGAGLSLYFRRGGRGWGSFLSLMTLIAYYMLSLFGEQLSRKGTVQPYFGGWLATTVALIASIGLFLLPRWSLPSFTRRFSNTKNGAAASVSAQSGKRLSMGRTRWLGFPSLLDLSLLRSLSLNCVFSYIALVAMFLIFTLFELWRFIIPTRSNLGVLGKYLFFLLPFATVQLLPTSLLIAVLVTYALVSRRSEAVAWWASGQSVYRLIIPGITFALLIGLLTWMIQERVMPRANIEQDSLRSQIRGGASRVITPTGRQWLASPAATGGMRLYSYEYDVGQESLKEPVVYDFDTEAVHLWRVTYGRTGVIGAGGLEIRDAVEVSLQGPQLEKRRAETVRVEGGASPEAFKLQLNKPMHLSTQGLSSYIKLVKPSGRDVTPLMIALQRKYAEPHTAWIMALFGIPLALSFGRRSAIAALCSAVGISLAYWAAVAVFQQLGEQGLLSPQVAAWTPLLIFATLGLYLLTRMRT